MLVDESGTQEAEQSRSKKKKKEKSLDGWRGF